ncbi:MAG: hypothetical protein Ct9H300mP1_13990 [Planctomycetaceae bacterium]|nr:MAG: hypothetical protein Ct9H300mP1_13990 [Planctomycetaceae bacterium]
MLNGAMLQKGFILVRRDRFAVVLNVTTPCRRTWCRRLFPPKSLIGPVTN